MSALLSLAMGKPVKQQLAMTGEISLTGKVAYQVHSVPTMCELLISGATSGWDQRENHSSKLSWYCNKYIVDYDLLLV